MRTKPIPGAQFDENQVLQVAVQHHQNGQLKEAKDLYLLILSRNPRNADVIHRLGTMAVQIEQFEKAEDFIRQAIAIGPATATMYINYGTALRNLERYDEAISAFDSAIKLAPENPDAYFNKGRCLIANQQLSEALEANAKAIELNPTDAEAWANLGAVQRKKGQHLESLYSFDKAAQLNPSLPEVYRNMGTNLLEMRLVEPALQMFRKSVTIDPDNLSARYFTNCHLLLAGRLKEGWEDFAVRFDKFEEVQQLRRPSPPPYWDGTDLHGKRFIIWTEQGIGEQLLAMSVLSEFKEEVEYCAVECWDRLVPVFRRSFPDTKFRSLLEHKDLVAEEDVPFDFQMPALDLLSRYRTSLDAFPQAKPFLKPNPEKTQKLRAKYEELAAGKRIVGISWKSTSERLQHFKSAELENWSIVIELPDLFIVNLQYGDYEEEWAEYKKKFPGAMYDDPEVDPIASLDDATAQIAAMDLVISVSNSNVHMAGAMGVPTWLLLPNSTSVIWYWFLDRTDSPWYPSVRIFRQRSILDEENPWWTEVLDEVSEALNAWMKEPLSRRLIP